MAGTILALNIKMNLCGMCYYCLCFIDVETEVQGNQVIYPRSRVKWDCNLVLKCFTPLSMTNYDQKDRACIEYIFLKKSLLYLCTCKFLFLLRC